MSLLTTIKFILDHPLNREHKLRSILRFAKWQIGSRLVPGAIVYEWVNQSKFLVETGETGLTGNVYTGLHEFADMGFLLHYLRPEDLFVDVGANVGSYTILACAAIGAKGIAFEPVPSTYEKLVQNLHINYLGDKVESVNSGVGAGQGTIAFTSDSDTTNHVVASGERYENTVTVNVTALDAALTGQFPSLIKIDVEGYETPVLEGARQTLKNPSLNAVIMELNGSGSRYGFDESEILALMLKCGFKTYSYNPISRTLIDLDGKNITSGNTLFIRDRFFVEERLKGAPRVEILGSFF
ncbi:FkbM family methyltransferase [Rhizobium sp. 'Codium 1']|uniref:FkbM family methyltransferase n=1 Tax=Rhizobium sp. 'Codium 1' TaxID=2940484 RepID=UPI001E3D2DBC|nr:FkbM family methyltransferase [Rhizobium sp. 'Codium 1']MCC8934869.1 FkbM family methyltransferase [Rhizobium sp. 'Codium 1']